MNKTPKWMFFTLLLAGFYNLVWGLWIIAFPKLSFTLLGAKPANPIEIWQCVGMIVGVYGIGYIIAATDPNKHWPIVLVGFLGKIFGPIGFIQALVKGVFPLSFGFNIIFNDIIWWVPFYLILKRAYDFYQNPLVEDISYSDFLSKDSTTLLLLLRHQGCTFSRKNIAELKNNLDKIKEKKWNLKIVHMGDNQELKELFKSYGISESIVMISDPKQRIYHKLKLNKGSFRALFGLKVWKKGIWAILKGYGIGPLRGDGFQLGGLFLYRGHEEVAVYKSCNASDEFPVKSWLKEYH